MELPVLNNSDRPRTDLASLRERLQTQTGRKYWRSLDELADTPEFQSWLHREFPENASEWLDPLGRRSFLKLMGASMGLAGLAACTRQPEERIVPYVRAPEEIVPGKPLFYATAMPMGTSALGVLAESHMGRPTKIEGNELHPGSLGSTDVFAQAAVLQLYDPDRSQTITYGGRIRTWDVFLSEMAGVLGRAGARPGGIRILTESVTSPTLAHQIRNLLRIFPTAKWHQYESINDDNFRAAFAEPVSVHYRFDQAARIVSLDADFLCGLPGESVRYARDFAKGRYVPGRETAMNRLYVIETTPTNTGAAADHHLSVAPAQIEALARGIAAGLGVNGGAAPSDERLAKWATAIANDLRQTQQQGGNSVVLAGRAQPPAVHALAHAINAALGNVGKTVIYTEPVPAQPAAQLESLRELVADLNAGKVELLLILGGNPVYTAPADLDFAAALVKAPNRVHLSLYKDETSELCQWHVPEAHWLEAWSDARAFDGTVSIVQPLIQPLYSGKSAHELLAGLTGNAQASGYDIVRGYWQSQYKGDNFEAYWRKALHDGVVPGTAAAVRQASLRDTGGAASQPAGSGLTAVFVPDPSVWDGRFANLGWLQELPKPLTKVTWDNVVMLSARTAERLGVHNEEVVKVTAGTRTITGPVWITPNHPDDVVTLPLGYGRERAGRVGNKVGFNAGALRTSDAFWSTRVQVERTGQRYRIASTQHHFMIDATQDGKIDGMYDRHLVRTATYEEYQKHPDFVQKFEAHHGPAHGHGEGDAHSKPAHVAARVPGQDLPSLYPEYKYEGYAWGMAINTGSCIGCNACVVACVSENNIPVVGKDQVMNGREMHWLRIDRYYEGDLDSPDTHWQPMLCQHCEKAPCEVVCPVAATVHDSEGLNTMVYNRCVGTRYCSNNCPYKVRRFNFFLYNDWETPSLTLLRNPDVTVRSRGVMEKCSYCVQRISAARIEASKEGRRITDGEVVTACQGVCPTRAIVFGDLNDPNSEVSKLKASNLNYGVLTEIGTQPRTTYLAKITNPNPELGDGVRS